jgi:uncharacterized membrane protein
MQKSLLALSLAGLGFSGYLSGVKFFTDGCAFNEACPYFLGYPACYFGFAMYVILTALSVLLFVGHIERPLIVRGIIGVSVLGIIFAGYFTLGEISTLFTEGFGAYMLGLPTCALGLIFYVTISIIAWRYLKSIK